MTKHLEEIEEISRLRLGIILLIRELEKHKEYKGIIDYLKDLVEGVDENTIRRNKVDFEIWKESLIKEEN